MVTPDVKTGARHRGSPGGRPFHLPSTLTVQGAYQVAMACGEIRARLAAAGRMPEHVMHMAEPGSRVATVATVEVLGLFDDAPRASAALSPKKAKGWAPAMPQPGRLHAIGMGELRELATREAIMSTFVPRGAATGMLVGPKAAIAHVLQVLRPGAFPASLAPGTWFLHREPASSESVG